ncbi:unnamed protein product, partial [Brassica rapa subsp. trilocularis]
GKTNLSHDSLNPAHVPYWWVNNPTLGEFCFTMIGRADIEGSKSNVAMNAWLPQASYPCDVPPQPNSPPDNVLRPDRPAEASLGSKRRGCYPASDSRTPKRAVPSPSPGRHEAVRSRHPANSRRVRNWDPRAQPSEPILFPKLRIHFADFPCLHCSIDQRLFTLET